MPGTREEGEQVSVVNGMYVHAVVPRHYEQIEDTEEKRHVKDMSGNCGRSRSQTNRQSLKGGTTCDHRQENEAFEMR